MRPDHPAAGTRVNEHELPDPKEIAVAQVFTDSAVIEKHLISRSYRDAFAVARGKEPAEEKDREGPEPEMK